jgi:hypothetical protein
MQSRSDKLAMLAFLVVGMFGVTLPLAVAGAGEEAKARAMPAAVVMDCGAYKVTLQPHDVASRSDAFEAAALLSASDPRGCTLLPR